ncbi:MAG: DUF5615 family PIN-like protein [Armatimonadetes bacterium]|nr:DUF5615 family PIN-like protein [Anaerolineae bacterium]
MSGTEPQRLKFYTDKHIPKAVALQLRERGVDVVRCEEVGMGDAADENHLTYAAANEYIIITRDADFKRLHDEWQNAGKYHAGIMFCVTRIQGIAAVGLLVREALLYDELIRGGAGTREADIVNRIIYVS